MNWPARSLQVAASAALLTGMLLLTSCATSAQSLSADGSRSAHASGEVPDVSAHAVPGHCTGRIDAISVDGDVTVPDGATCELLGTRVEGNVSIGHGARLYARGVDVDGDIEGEQVVALEVTEDSNVGGNLQLESGGTAVVTNSHVDGDLSWEDQHGELVTRDSTVRGNLELDSNTGGVTVSRTAVGGDLSCQDNSPAPQGGDNNVSGDEDDQCDGL